MSTPIFALCDRFVQRHSELDPVMATSLGLDRPGVSGTPGTDYSPDGEAARAELLRDTLRELATLTPTGQADEFAAAHLRERLEAQLAAYDLGEPLRNLRAPFGLLQVLRNSVDLMPKDSDDAWQQVAARVAAVPQMLASWRTALRAGLDRGLVAGRRQALAAAEQAQRSAEGRSFQTVVNDYGHGPLRDQLVTAADAAHAAYAEIADWLRQVYAPQAAAADGVGAERYAVASRISLGADIDPVEAYEWAWEELRRLEEEMATEAHRVRPGASIDEAIAHLNEHEYVVGAEAYHHWLQERHDEAIAALDGVHFDIAPPLKRVDVVTLPHSSAGSAYYNAPSEDLSRPGRTCWPIAGRERFAVWGELTTVFHEGVPGHHLQLGHVLLERDQLSRYARISRVSAHSEGWALYAERLADELGWHRTRGTRLGMLKASAMRAARVVIDIGLHLDLPLPAQEARRHGDRWSFDTAVAVLRDRGRIAGHRLHPEVVRYCGWPGQASSYKLGERAWLAARQEARQRLGADFDLKRWHTQALSLGPVGLATLGESLRTVG